MKKFKVNFYNKNMDACFCVVRAKDAFNAILEAQKDYKKGFVDEIRSVDIIA